MEQNNTILNLQGLKNCLKYMSRGKPLSLPKMQEAEVENNE